MRAIWLLFIIGIICVPMISASEDGQGTMYVGVLCHHNLFSKEVIIMGENTTENIFLNPSGVFEGRFPPGNYFLKLLDGNGGQPELKGVTVYEGYQSQVWFIGHAVSGHRVQPTAMPTITPTPTECRVWIPPYTIWVPNEFCVSCKGECKLIPIVIPGHWEPCHGGK